MRFYFKGLFLLIFLAVSLFAQTDEWNYETKFVKAGTVNVYSDANTNSKVVGKIYYLEKVIVVEDSKHPLPFGWTKVVYPLQGFVEKTYLITPQEKRELDIRFGNKPQKERGKEDVVLPSTCKSEFVFVKALPFNAAKTVGFLKEDEPLLLLVEKEFPNALWVKTLYPFSGYVKRSDVNWGSNNLRLTLGAFYGAWNVPYEKNLTNKNNPVGGFVVLDKQSWIFSPGIGFLTTSTHSEMFLLKTKLLFLFTQLNFLSLFNNHLDLYGTIGGGYFFSSFENTKYPNLPTYYPLLKTQGFAYLTGGGFNVNIFDFFIGANYLFWNTPKEAVFGDEPKPGDLTNQYKLFPGENVLNVTIGYRINF